MKITSRDNSGIYGIIMNNSLYIGKSKNINRRIQEHTRNMKKGVIENKKILNLWKKGFTPYFFIIENCSIEELSKKEQFYIDTLNPELNIIHNVYNGNN